LTAFCYAPSKIRSYLVRRFAHYCGQDVMVMVTAYVFAITFLTSLLTLDSLVREPLVTRIEGERAHQLRQLRFQPMISY
jgi:hypothetical protein